MADWYNHVELEQPAQLAVLVVAEQLRCGSPPRRLAELRHRAMDATVPAMALPADAVTQVESYCDARVRRTCARRCGSSTRCAGTRSRSSSAARRGVRTSVRSGRQLRYDGLWALYCSDSNGRWWRYDEAAPASERRAVARRDGRGRHRHLLGLTPLRGASSPGRETVTPLADGTAQTRDAAASSLPPASRRAVRGSVPPRHGSRRRGRQGCRKPSRG